MKTEAIGVVEVLFFTNAVTALQQMLTTAYVEVLDCKKYLGGRLVSVIICGNVSNVTTAIHGAQQAFEGNNALRNAVVIANPHSEILKFLTK